MKCAARKDAKEQRTISLFFPFAGFATLREI